MRAPRSPGPFGSRSPRRRTRAGRGRDRSRESGSRDRHPALRHRRRAERRRRSRAPRRSGSRPASPRRATPPSENRATASARRSPDTELQPVEPSRIQTAPTRAPITATPTANRPSGDGARGSTHVSSSCPRRLESRTAHDRSAAGCDRECGGGTPKRADQELDLEPERDEEHDENRDGVAQLGRPENPREDEDDERDA